MNNLTQAKFTEIIGKFKNIPEFIVIGDIGIDLYTKGEVTRISPEAPVPILNVKKSWAKLGLAANVAHNLNSLGLKSYVVGVVGDDEKANQLEALLEDIELRTWGIIRDSNSLTIVKERITTDSQQICRIDYEDIKAISYDIKKMVIKRFEEVILDDNHPVVIIEDYSKGFFEQDLLQFIIKRSKEKQIFVAVDPGKLTNPIFYKGCDLLKPNREEAKKMLSSLGIDATSLSLEECGNLLKEKLEVKYLIITLGSDGMALWDRNEKMIKIPTLAEEVFDVSGAGDTAISLLTACLQAGASLIEAAWISNCGAGVVVAKTGTATVTVRELEAYFKKISIKLNS